MLVNSENIFLNAEVTFNNKKYYVVKINNVTCYISDKKNFLQRFKESDLKWKDYCKRHNGIMVKYNLLSIDKNELLKKDDFILKEKKKRYLTSYEGRELKEIWNRIKLNYKNVKYGKSYMYTVEYRGNKFYRVLKANYLEGWMLLNVNNEYVFYDVKNNEWTLFDKTIHIKNNFIRNVKNNDFIEKIA